MKDGFIKVAAISSKVRVADCEFNKNEIIKYIDIEYKKGAKILVFPELAISAYTCGDLFLQDLLIEACKLALKDIILSTKNKKAIIFIGVPFRYRSKLYNTAAVINNGKLLALIPKTFIPNYSEFYELRYFTGAEKIKDSFVNIFDEEVYFGTKCLFSPKIFSALRIGVEICEDLWTPNSPSIAAALAGANIIVNLSASNEIVAKASYRERLIENHSAKLYSGYIYASCGEGESSTDLVFSAHNIIAECGNILAQSNRFSANAIEAELDIQRLESFRQRENTFEIDNGAYIDIDFELDFEETEISRYINPHPFIPAESEYKYLDDILNIQAYSLKQRLEHTNIQNIILGISGGLDSTLALVACIKCFDLMNISRKNIHCITMPSFGTTDRTYNNACELCKSLDVDLKEINISKAVTLHFNDIAQDMDKHDITYENSQARERTQILMDIANQKNALVIGTGDLSELALGFSTYNGDHMSMYAINSSIPKSLIRYLIRYYADNQNDKIKNILYDILDTPVSPELLPPKEGEIFQKTEDIVGPYELHDFFLYNMLRLSFSPKKIYRLANIAFKNVYTKEIILKYLKLFYKRFFTQQFKRSCLPDGPKVGTVAISPRGDLRMPSDACINIWLKEVESIDNKLR